MLTTLQGKKSYIFAALIAAATFAYQMAWVDRAFYEAAIALLGASGLAALRAGMAKLTV